MVSVCRSALCLLAFVQALQPIAWPGSVVTTEPKETSTPSDARQRIHLAQQVNGLQSVGAPWHLKATYEIFGPDGKSKTQGTYEQWRLTAKRYRLAFRNPAQSVDVYADDRGVFRGEGSASLRRPLNLIEDLIMRPMAPLEESDTTVLKNYERKFGGDSKLPCTAVISRDKSQINENAAAGYCFAPNNAALVYKTSPDGNFQTFFEHISLVSGHYFAKDIQVFVVGNPWLKVHVDTLDALQPADMSQMAVPATAVQVTPPDVQPLSFIEGHLLQKVTPQYPSEAKLSGVQGTVVVAVTIGRDGKIKDLEVLGGLPMLQKPAADAVRQWVYKPFLHNGEPVEFETTIHVVFMLGGTASGKIIPDVP